MERGVFDIEAVKQANSDLIATIEESLQIADEGKAKRAAAEEELQKMEAGTEGNPGFGQGTQGRHRCQRRRKRAGLR